jgi:acetyl esterase/lipase
MATPGYFDTLNAYKWVRSSLAALLGLPISSVLVSGSSAGGYLALTTASLVGEKPDALLLIYRMLESANSRCTTLGPNIFGQSAIETEPVLREFPKRRGKDETRERISAYAMPPVVAGDRQYALVSALHIEGLFVNYLTSVDGLARAIADRGVETIPEEHRRLFPLSFDRLANMPRTLLLHGLNGLTIPAECSLKAARRGWVPRRPWSSPRMQSTDLMCVLGM